jgi:uncharacterized damage-inducible protein DinB
MDDQVLRLALLQLLTAGHAHVTVEKALAGLPPELRGRRPQAEVHSVWEELEHMRIAQEDILRYTLDPAWTSPEWPKGYWPTRAEPTEAAWSSSVSRFRADLEELGGLVRDPQRDLTAKIPHGEGRTLLRQVLLVADHNAYHVGQVVQARRLLGAWSGS